MARVFTDYPETSTDALELDEKARSKKIRKLQKKIKRLEKLIRKMGKQKNADESEEASESRETEKNNERSFFTRVKDAFLRALPSIFRTAAKIVVSTLCEYAADKCSKREKVA